MENLNWIQEADKKIKHKMRIVAERNMHKIPYTAHDGVFDDWSDRIYWWTNGFWGGIMWQMYQATGDALYRKIAEENEEKLDDCFMHLGGMDHDSGFRWLTTAVANYQMTGNKQSRVRGIMAADNMAGRFNPVGKFIRAWNDGGEGGNIGNGVNAGLAIIDCMMNLPLLYWAYKELNDPRYLHIATAHADITKEHFVRQDGSVKHIVEFDPATGTYLGSRGGQGYAKGSSWTRGQSWAIYGFVLSYIHTGNESYLDTAKKIANYYIANIRALDTELF